MGDLMGVHIFLVESGNLLELPVLLHIELLGGILLHTNHKDQRVFAAGAGDDVQIVGDRLDLPCKGQFGVDAMVALRLNIVEGITAGAAVAAARNIAADRTEAGVGGCQRVKERSSPQR